MRILFVGDLRPGRTSGQRCAAAKRLGHAVSTVDVTEVGASLPLRGARRFVDKVALRLGRHLDLNGLSAKVLETARGDVEVLWLEKVLTLTAGAMRAFKAARPGRKIVIYHPDDFRSRFNWADHYNALRDEIDLIVTTKSYNVAEYEALGFRNILFVNKSFDPVEHRPPHDYDRTRLRTDFDVDVGFVGGFERDRCELICEIARRGIPVRIVGSFWDRAGPLPANVTVEHGDLGAGAYAERIFRTKINLAFLRKQNRDLQTARSFEIPACGGFMLTEATDELMALFRPGIEAEFFASADELYEKCVRYLADDAARETIAREGCRRVWEGKCRSDDVVASVLEVLYGSH